MRARARVSPDQRARADRAALREAERITPISASFRIIGTGSLAEEVRDAVQKIHGAAAREAATGQPQSDLEEFTGVAPEQQQREAEAAPISAERLRSIVERVERLEEERKALAADIKDIYSEAKSAGFEPKVLRRLIRERKREPAELEEEETLLELYKRALGM